MSEILYTIGHSTHSIEKLIDLLNEHDVSAIAEVRSQPYSRINPQFNRESLTAALNAAGIAYVFLGRELGARSEDRNCYVDGKVQYERLAQTDLFQEGIGRLTEGVRKHRIALMCAEKDPITCHRMVLVCHELRRRPFKIVHIREDGRLETNSEAEKRMVKDTGLPESDLFMSGDELVEEAYRRQGQRIAWVQATRVLTEEPTSLMNTDPSI